MKTLSASESSVSIYQFTSRIVPERFESSAIRQIGFVFLRYVTTCNNNFYWWKLLDLSNIGRRIDFRSCCQTPKTFRIGIRRTSEQDMSSTKRREWNDSTYILCLRAEFVLWRITSLNELECDCFSPVLHKICWLMFNPLNLELNPIYLLALLAHHFLHVSRIRVKSLTIRLLMSYIYIWSTYSWCF